MPTAAQLVDAAIEGDRLALARLITLVERDSPEAPWLLQRLFPRCGRAYQVGFTGPPGGGKSTVVDQVTAALRARPGSPTVGIIAVDPTSPFTGGAILGDRIRMQRHYKDPGVFVRSMATRGSHGGLPAVARRVATVLDAAGKDYVLIETVGVGQTELDIMEVADTVVVILVPEAGDSIQTMKAGLMEIGDVFVVNKADRGGADKLAQEIKAMLHLSPERQWDPPVLLTQGTTGRGIPELVQAIERHRAALTSSGDLEAKRQRRRSTEFFRAVEEKISAGLHRLVATNGDLRTFVQRIQEGKVDPYSAAMEVLRDRAILHRWFTTLEA